MKIILHLFNKIYSVRSDLFVINVKSSYHCLTSILLRLSHSLFWLVAGSCQLRQGSASFMSKSTHFTFRKVVSLWVFFDWPVRCCLTLPNKSSCTETWNNNNLKKLWGSAIYTWPHSNVFMTCKQSKQFQYHVIFIHLGKKKFWYNVLFIHWVNVIFFQDWPKPVIV